MATLADIRQQYPQYSDMSDADLASALHKKFYSDMPREQFNAKIGLAAPEKPSEPGFFGKLVSAVTDIPSEIATAAKDAGSTIADNLNPFSQKRMDAFREQAKRPLDIAGNAKKTWEDFKSVGSGIAAVPALIASPITGTARSLIGHPYSAVTGLPYEDAKGAVDLAMMAVTPRGVTPAGIATRPAPAPTVAELKQSYKDAFRSPEVQGVQIAPQSTANLAAQLETELAAKGFRPTPKSAGETLAEVGRMRPAPGTAAVVIDDLENTRKALRITATERQADGTLTPDAVAAKTAIRKIDDYLENLPAGEVIAGDAATASAKMKDARSDYAASKGSAGLMERVERAENNAGAANSGMNVENALRQQIKQILNSPKQRAQYGPEVQEAMRQFVRGSLPAEAVRALGNLLGGGGGMHGAGMAIAGGMTAGPWGILTPLAGAALKGAGNRMAASKVATLDEMIRAQSALARSRPPVPASLPGGLLGAIYPGLLPPGLGTVATLHGILGERR